MPVDATPNYIPVRMRRKIFVVNDHMAVGAAGSAWDIRIFIDALFGEFRDRSKFTYSEIKTFLEQYASSGRGGEIVEQIGLIIVAEASDWRGYLSKGLTNRRELTSQRFGKVVTIGTGSDSIVEQVNNLDNKYEYGMSQPPDGKSGFPEFGALGTNLMLLANLYWKEFMSPENIFDAWGGAYDLIYQDSNKVFRHLNDYTIVLRRFDADQADKGLQLANVLKYERRSELSFIMMLNNGKLDFFGAKDITAPDDPISFTLGKDELTMNSRMHISIIDVCKGNRFLPPIVQIEGFDPVQDGKQMVFTDFDEERRLRVFFHAEHDAWLQEQAMSYYKEHAHRLF